MDLVRNRNDIFDDLVKVSLTTALKYSVLKKVHFILSEEKSNNPVHMIVTVDDRLICSGNPESTFQFVLIFESIKDENNKSENQIQTLASQGKDGIIYITFKFINWLNKGNVVNPYAVPTLLTDKIKLIDIKAPGSDTSYGIYIDLEASGSIIGIKCDVTLYYDIIGEKQPIEEQLTVDDSVSPIEESIEVKKEESSDNTNE